MTAFQLNPLAVSSAPVLRAIRAGGWSNRAELARAADRNPKNIARDLDFLIGAGLITDEASPALTPDGIAQIEAVDRVETSIGDEPGLPGGSRFPWQVGDIRLIPHAEIRPDPGNARRDWASDEAREELDHLREDIIQLGLLQNLVVRTSSAEVVAAGEAPWTLVGGERRWRAIGLAIFDDDWPADRPIPCRVVDQNDLGHRLAALSENLQRRNLNPLEKAKAFEGLAEAFIANGVDETRVNREIADRVGVTIEHVQQHRSFMKLDEADQVRLTLPKDDPKRLTVSDARKKLAAKAAEPDTIALDPAARLAWIELTDAAYRCGEHGNLWNPVIVAHDARATPEAGALADLGAIQFNDLGQYGRTLGWFTAKRDYSANSVRIDPPFPLAMLESDQARTACLRAEQIAALGDAAPVWPEAGVTYATPWIARPGDMTPEGVALVQAAERQRAENIRVQEEREAALIARNKRWAEARRRHVELFAESVNQPVWGDPEQTLQIAAAVGRDLPWSVNGRGHVLDAQGDIVSNLVGYGICTDRDHVVARMIVAAVNAAGGVATPAEAPEDEEPEQNIIGDEPDAETNAADDAAGGKD